ncbi:uncharacterized protein L201_006428 [Kwoniella dendrophila CBS 6074]|uniref:Zn(2)-C6 fungal-type domain-containing protein n=1 Tax=Kwoniella dendrophila CBS 6074 TaxID=1295534 RepID=A0AAX4K3P0_9TREE
MDFGGASNSAAFQSFKTSQPNPLSSTASTSSSSTVLASASSPGETSKTGKNQRKRSGCLTCRLRKKKCDEGKPACGACTRLGLDCMGYEAKRPTWMNKKDKVKDATAQIKQTVNETRSARMRSHWAARAASVSAKGEDEQSLSYSPESSAILGEQGDMCTNKSTTLNALPSGEPPLASTSSMPVPSTSYSTEYTYSGGPVRTARQQHFTSMPTTYHHQPTVTPAPTESYVPTSAATSPLIDPDILNLLGLGPPTKPMQPDNYFPLYPQLPNTLWFPYPSTLESRESLEDMRYFHHYLTVILPLTYRFDNQPISDLVAPLALQNPRVLQAFSAIAALHISSKKTPHLLTNANLMQGTMEPVPNADDVFARTTIQATIRELQSLPAAELGSDDSILAALSANSFNLFDGGESKSWVETAELCRRCLAAVLDGVGGVGSSFSGYRPQIDISALMDRLGHLVSPLMWVDILMSVTQNKASQYLSIYRIFLLDRYRSPGKVSKLLQETVMGCDNTTRLALAETISLSEWKDKCVRSGTLSHRSLVERADAIERLLGERKWREEHLFEPEDPSNIHRMAMSNVFHHGVRVLLATVVDGCFPNVPDVAAAVQDTADALMAFDKYDGQGAADKLMIFPIVIAGCHADRPVLQRVFRNRFTRLNDENAAFGNSRTALRLMEEVWSRRSQVASEQTEVHWRQVMFELYEGGLLLI